MRWGVIGVFVIVLTVLSLGTADGQTCTSSGVVPPVCNGAIWVTNASTLSDAAVLFKVIAKDLSPINPSGQSVHVRICDAQNPSDQFGVSVFRIANPKWLERCITPVGGSCTEYATPKPATSKSDTSFFIIDFVEEESVGTNLNFPNVRFQVTAPGWETLKVMRVASENNDPGIFAGFGGPGCP